jgi:polyisoprenoid-binding protein YceI
MFKFSVAQTFHPSDDGSKVHFVIKNFGINTGGDFTGLKGTINFNPADPEKSEFNVSISAATINTNIKARDNDLRKAYYFDVDRFPLISFSSTKVVKSATDGHYFITGNLTIKGVTRQIQFGFKATPANDGYLFSGGFAINRIDFGIGGNSLVLSDNVSVTLSVLAKK